MGTEEKKFNYCRHFTKRVEKTHSTHKLIEISTNLLLYISLLVVYKKKKCIISFRYHRKLEFRTQKNRKNILTFRFMFRFQF